MVERVVLLPARVAGGCRTRQRVAAELTRQRVAAELTRQRVAAELDKGWLWNSTTELDTDMKFAAFVAAAAIGAEGQRQRCARDLLNYNSSAVYDIMLLYDMRDNGISAVLPQLVSNISRTFTQVVSRQPGNRMGLMTFTDIPVSPLGGLTDYCANLSVPLTNSSVAFRSALWGMSPQSGGDFPGSQLIALQHVLRSPSVGWRANDYVSPGGWPLIKILIFVPSSPFHDEQDAADLAPLANFRPDDGTGILECHVGGKDYPSRNAVRMALDETNVVLSLVLRPSFVRDYVSLIYDIADESMMSLGRMRDDTLDFTEGLNISLRTIRYCAPEEPTTTEEPVLPALEVVYLQDISNSAREYIGLLKHEVPNAFRQLQSAYPEGRFVFAAFVDSPLFPGASHYWRYGQLSADLDMFDEALERAFIPSSSDVGSMTMGALLDLADDTGVGFTTPADAAQVPVHRAVVVSTTDKPPVLSSSALREGMMCTSMMCTSQTKFSSYEQLATKLNEMGSGTTHLVFAVPDDLVDLWGEVAANLTLVGVPASVRPILDVVGALGGAADPAGVLIQ